MKNKAKQLYGKFLFQVGVWCFVKLFRYIDVYCPGLDKDKDALVKGVAFSNKKSFIDYIAKYEKK